MDYTFGYPPKNTKSKSLMSQDQKPIEFQEQERVLENHDLTQAVQPMVDEIQDQIDKEMLANLQQAAEAELKQVEAQTNRKTTVDSITTEVPSTGLNSDERIRIEREAAERERLRRRLLGF